MSCFAKIFQREDQQVIVCLDQDQPGIVVTFRDDADSIYVSPRWQFTPKNDERTALAAAWRLAERALERADEDWAFGVRQQILAMMESERLDDSDAIERGTLQ